MTLAVIVGGLLGISLVGLIVYFLPTIVALIRQRVNIGQVIIVNLLLGWSQIGWVVALVVAFGKTKDQVQRACAAAGYSQPGEASRPTGPPGPAARPSTAMAARAGEAGRGMSGVRSVLSGRLETALLSRWRDGVFPLI